MTGVVEVYNITRGRRNASLLDLDKPAIVEIMEVSGSNAEKSPIYGTDDKKPLQEKEIPQRILLIKEKSCILSINLTYNAKKWCQTDPIWRSLTPTRK